MFDIILPARARARKSHVNREGTAPEFVLLLLANPMGRDHLTALLDALLAPDVFGVAARLASDATAGLNELPGDYDLGFVVDDDLMGGWTNRHASEYAMRFRSGPTPE